MLQISSIVYTRLYETRAQAILSIIDVEKIMRDIFTLEEFLCKFLWAKITQYVNGKTDQRTDYDGLIIRTEIW